MRQRYRLLASYLACPSLQAIFCGLLLVILGTGCSARGLHPDWMSAKPPLLSQDDRPSETPYTIGAGDVLMVAPISGDPPIRVEVSLNGQIKLPGRPPIPAAHRTCAAIEEEISREMPARVVVTSYRSQSLLVAGLHDEKAPRPEPYCGPETIAQFLKRVGCPDCQTGYRVRVVRRSEEVGGEPEIFAEEMDAQGKRRDAHRAPLRLQPGDYVYVDRNFGRKGPLTLMTDRGFFGSAIGPAKQLRLAQAVDELEMRR